MPISTHHVLFASFLALSGCVIDLTGNEPSLEQQQRTAEQEDETELNCSLRVSSAREPEDSYFADVELLLEGACHDLGGETPPAGLELWFAHSYQDEEGQTYSQHFQAPATTGDTGAGDMVFEADDDEARLSGFVSFPAGSHQLCLFAEDEAGNRSGDEACTDLRVRPANTPPRCEILLPLDGNTGVLGEPLRLEGLVGDVEQGTGSLHVEWRSDLVGVPLATLSPDPNGRVSAEADLPTETPARHEISLYVEDERGASCLDVVRYVVGAGPSVRLDSPVPDARLDRHEPFTLEGSFEDAENDCETLDVEWWLVGPSGELSFAAGPWAATGCSDSYLLDPAVEGPLPMGDAHFYLLVTDEDGATNADLAWVSIGDCAQDWYLDGDGDGYGSDELITSCTQPSGTVPRSGDCDDQDPTVHPAAMEACNGVDDDCDGGVDSGYHLDWFYADADGDGYGDDAAPFDADGDGVGELVCTQASLPGWTIIGGDCDDGSATIHPGATEVCDVSNIDEDCDGSADDGSATGQATWHRDADGDGYGSSATTSACDQPAGYVADSTDCDDGSATIHPGATEVCDAANTDEDCDGQADDVDSAASGKTTWYRDADGDGYGSDSTTAACDLPSGYVSNSSDCDDGCSSCYLGASEILQDGGDNDCDGQVDECGHNLSACSASSADLVSCCIEALGSAGGTVTMDWSGESSFSETIELVSDLTLEGRGKTDTILRFTGARQDDLLQGYDTSDVTLRDFTLYGTRSTADCTCNSSGDSCDLGSGKSGDSCDTESQAGIILKKDTGSGISDILIEDVSVKYCWQYGLHIKYATDVKIDGLTAGYNGYYRAEDHNVYVYRSDNVLITDTGSRYSAGHGINIRGCNDVVVHDTTVGYNHHAGIRASGAATEQSDGSWTGEDSTDILFDNTDSFGNNNEGVQMNIEHGYNVHRACVMNSAIEDNDIGVEFSYVSHYQRSGNSYSSNGTKESIGSSSQDSSVCGALPTSGFTWSY